MVLSASISTRRGSTASGNSRPDLKWVAGNLYERLEAPELANVGILNLDEYGEVGNRSAQVDFPLIRGLVKRGLAAFGEFALFWNQDLDAVVRRRQNRGEALRRHADMVCEALRGCLPRRELSSEMLLPAGSEKELDSGFVGVLGAFEIYRGSARAPDGQPARHPAVTDWKNSSNVSPPCSCIPRYIRSSSSAGGKSARTKSFSSGVRCAYLDTQRDQLPRAVTA